MALLAAIGLFHIWGSVLAAAPTESATTTVQIVGPRAHVEVERVMSLSSLKAPNSGGLAVFDFGVPTNASGLAVEVEDAREAPLRPVSWSASPGGRPARVERIPFDPSATFRVVFSGGSSRDYVLVRYAYEVPLVCDGGRWQLTLPAASDLAPVVGALRLTARFPAPLRLRRVQVGTERQELSGRTWRYNGRLSPQTTTTVWLEPFFVHAKTGTDVAQLMASVTTSSREAWLGVCRAPVAAPAVRPTIVMAVVDASRSVGPAGLSHERELLRSFLTKISPDTVFNVVPFHREAAPLFPLARLVTKETLGIVDQALVPDRLANGSDLVHALEVARGHLAAEQRDHPERLGVLLLITDGSLSELPSARALASAAPAVSTAVAVVRAETDEVPWTPAQRWLRELPEKNGGVFRLVNPPNVNRQGEAMADAMGAGDWFNLRWSTASVAPVLGPGAGLVAGLPLRNNASPPPLLYVQNGRRHSVPVPQVTLPKDWGGGAAVAEAGKRLSSGVEVYRYPLLPPPEPVLEKGELERSVLRNVLSLAYLPRARACYLNRNAKDARSRDLTGRVRLSLEIERGELLSATVLASTLGEPDIERCLVENAYALILPRPTGRDAPVQALLNLVFRPTPAEATVDGAPSRLDEEIEILLGPKRVLDPANPGASLPGI